jgi:hypothetical protein
MLRPKQTPLGKSRTYWGFSFSSVAGVWWLGAGSGSGWSRAQSRAQSAVDNTNGNGAAPHDALVPRILEPEIVDAEVAGSVRVLALTNSFAMTRVEKFIPEGGTLARRARGCNRSTIPVARAGIARLLYSLRCQRERDVARVLYRVREIAVTEKLETGMLERAPRDNECVHRPPVGLDDEHLGRLGRVEVVVLATASEFSLQELTDNPQLDLIER